MHGLLATRQVFNDSFQSRLNVYLIAKKKLHYYPSSIITHKNLSTTPFITCNTCYSFSCYLLRHHRCCKMQPPARCSNHRCFYIDQCDSEASEGNFMLFKWRTITVRIILCLLFTKYSSLNWCPNSFELQTT